MGSLVQMGLANALLAAVLSLLALAAGRFSRRPALTHSLWVLVLLKLVTPPVLSLPVPGWRTGEAAKVEAAEPSAAVAEATPEPAAPTQRVAPMPAMMNVEDVALKRVPLPPVLPGEGFAEDAGAVVTLVGDPPPVASMPSVEGPPATEKVDWLAFLGWIWVGGAVYFLLVNVWRIGRFQRLLRYARPAPYDLRQQTAALAQRLGLTRCPEVYVLPGPVPPLLWAVGGRAALFFPSSLLPRLRESQRATLIVHELAHVARRDHWVRWLELFAGCLYWWYPLTWLARARLRSAEEECCDAWVTSELPQFRPAYAGALLETVDFLSRVPAALPPAASGFGRVHQLKRRLTMIVRGSTPRGLSWLGKLAVLALAVGLPLMPGPARTAAPPAAEVAKKADATKADAASSDEPSQYQNQSRLMTGGGGQVWQSAVSPDGKTLAVVAGGTGDNEGALTLYDLPDGKERLTLSHVKPLRCVAFSPDGKHLATGDFNNEAQLRDPKTGAVRLTLKGHTGSVNGITFLHDSKLVVTASLDKNLKVWQVADGKNTKTLTGHTDWVLNVSASPDGKTLLSTSKDMTARVWDVPAFATRHVLKGHTNWAEAGACSPDNKTVATFGLEGTAKLWDATTGKHVRDLSVPGGALAGVFFDSGKKLATVGHQMRLALWDVESGREGAFVLTGHTSSVYGLTATPDGATLVTGSWDKSVKLWDAAKGEEKKKLTAKRYQDDANFPLLALSVSPDGKYLAVAGEEKGVKILDAESGLLLHLLEGHDDIVAGVAFSADSKTLATAGFDGNVILWDAASGKRKETLKGHENWVFNVAFSPDGKWLASCGYDRTVRLWDAKTGKFIEKLEFKHKGGVRCLAWSADSKRLASGGTDKAVRVWDLDKKAVAHTLKGHEDPIRGVAFLPDGKRLVSASEDQTVRLWDLAEDKQVGSYQHTDVIRGLALSPRGKSLVVVAQDRSMRILDPVSLTQRMIQYAHTQAVTCAAYTPDARGLYTGGADRTIRKWLAAVDARSPLLTIREGGGKQMWVSSYSPDGKWLVTAGGDKAIRVRPSMQGARPWALQGLDSAVFGMTVSPDGSTLATGCDDNTVKLWDVKTGRRKGTLTGHKQRVWMMAFSPDGKKLASVAGPWDKPGEPGEAKVWDVGASKEICDLPAHNAPVMAVAWSKDGKHVVTGARDGSARLIDGETFKEKAELKGHTDAARFAVFAPGDKYVATASFDGTVKVWSVEGGKEVTSFKAHEKGANCLAWSPDGKLLATVSRPGDEQQPPGEVKLWDVTMPEGGPPTFKPRATLKGHAGFVLCCAFSPDGKTLATTGGQFSQYGETLIWDVATGKERMQLHGHRMWCEGMTFGKDGTLYTGGGTANTRGEVRAWHVEPPGWFVENAHKGEVCCAAWSKDGKLLATGCTDSSIKVWDAVTGKIKTELTGHKKMVRCLAFSPDGKSLASGSSDNTVRLWDLEGDVEAIELARHRLGVTAVAFSPDGKWLATSSADPTFQNRTGETKVFDVKTGKERQGVAWNNLPALSLAFSPNGKMLATGSQGANNLKLYEVESGKLVRTVAGANSVRAIAWSPDSKRIAATHGQGSTRGNGSIQVWDAATGQETMALVGHTGLCLGVSYSHDGKRLASASNDGTVKVWDLDGPGMLITMGTRPPTPKQ